MIAALLPRSMIMLSDDLVSQTPHNVRTVQRDLAIRCQKNNFSSLFFTANGLKVKTLQLLAE